MGEAAADYFLPLFKLAKELDPQKRPCTLVNVQMISFENEVTKDVCDVICLNRYYGWYECGGDLPSAEKNLRAESSLPNLVPTPLPVSTTPLRSCSPKSIRSIITR